MMVLSAAREDAPHCREPAACCEGGKGHVSCEMLVLNLGESGYLNHDSLEALRRLGRDLQGTGRRLLVVAPPETEACQVLIDTSDLEFRVCGSLEEAHDLCQQGSER